LPCKVKCKKLDHLYAPISNTAFRFRDISRVSRDQMHMRMSDGLPCYRTDVDPDIIPVGRKETLDTPTHGVDQFKDRHDFDFRQIEETVEVTARNDEGMPEGDRKGVKHCEHQGITEYDPLLRDATERALRD